jgi:pSer/pThr/pTyr-binding forkhead associated (FHA) protein
LEFVQVSDARNGGSISRLGSVIQFKPRKREGFFPEPLEKYSSIAQTEVRGKVDTPEFARAQAPSMELVDGRTRRNVVVDCFSFAIGRSLESNLALPQSYVSRSHAMITQEGDQFVLEDTRSRHGTFVNGEQVNRDRFDPAI